MDKIKLRQHFLALRNQIPADQKNAWDVVVCKKLLKYLQNLKPKAVHTYLPMGSEIDFYSVIDYLIKQKVTVVCPKTLNKPYLQHLILSSLDDIKLGEFKTKYPDNENEYQGFYDLIIVPGIVFNSKKFRLGYGGGYYDHFLKSQPKAVKLGLFYSFQRDDELPIESHDIPLDIIITN